MRLNGKRVALGQLLAELTAAGLAVPALGQTDDDLHTYDQDGLPAELPSGAATVVAAHVPPPVPERPDFGADSQTDAQLAASAAQAVASLRAYLGLATPTLGQSVAALKIVIRLVLYFVQRELRS